MNIIVAIDNNGSGNKEIKIKFKKLKELKKIPFIK